MTDTWHEVFNYGVPFVILVAIGIAIWRVSQRLVKWAFGDDTKNPPTEGILTKKLDSAIRRDERMITFIEGMEESRASQQELCRTHATSMEKIAECVSQDIVGATARSAALDELLKIHTDLKTPNSTANAVRSVEQLRKAAVATCKLGRELAGNSQDATSKLICKHCEAIEHILRVSDSGNIEL